MLDIGLVPRTAEANVDAPQVTEQVKLYVDPVDGQLKWKNSAGVTTPVADAVLMPMAFIDDSADEPTTGNELAFIPTGDSGVPDQFKGYTEQSPEADGDTRLNYFVIRAGTYELNFLGLKSPDSGILKVYIDTVEVATIDWYAAVPDYNVVVTIPGIVLTSGVHKIETVVTGKNGLSASYKYKTTQRFLC
jgi:hypothetical protein